MMTKLLISKGYHGLIHIYTVSQKKLHPFYFCDIFVTVIRFC